MAIAVWLRGVSLEQLKLWADQLRAARIQLAAGGRIVSVSYEAKSVTYSNADSGRLYADLADILAAIAELEGAPLRRGPIYAAF
jgi:hypothetical protein